MQLWNGTESAVTLEYMLLLQLLSSASAGAIVAILDRYGRTDVTSCDGDHLLEVDHMAQNVAKVAAGAGSSNAYENRPFHSYAGRKSYIRELCWNE